MRMSLKQLLQHPNRDSLLAVNSKSKKVASESVDKNLSVKPVAAKVPAHGFMASPGTFAVSLPDAAHRWCFVVPGDPMGKPRMTQRDRWNQRPVVLRYRAYCDLIRACAGAVPADPFYLVVYAHVAMPGSWSRKKKEALRGRFCRQRPDYDNIAKAVGDALFREDSVLGGGQCLKFWCAEGQQRTEVMVLCGYGAATGPPCAS